MQPGSVNLIGKTLDERYLVEEGSADASLYRAKDLSRNYGVAVQVVDDARNESKTQARYKHGTEIAGKLAHPNIVRLYSYNQSEEGMPFLVMDWVSGQTLADLMKQKGRLNTRDCISIFSQICDALDHAHGKGVVHRNLRPSNIILLSGSGNAYVVKVTGFAQAKEQGEKETRIDLLQLGQLEGSYASPEQCTGAKIDQRSDVYSLACMLYECLTGHAPFAGGNSAEVMQKHVSEPAPTLRAIDGLEHGRQLEAILERALAKSPGSRYQSAAEFSRDLNLIGEVPEAEWNMQALAKKVPDIPTSSCPFASCGFLKGLLKAVLVTAALAIVAGIALVAVAVMDIDVPPLLQYKVSMQERLLPRGDARLVRNQNKLTEFYRLNGSYAEAWRLKEKMDGR